MVADAADARRCGLISVVLCAGNQPDRLARSLAAILAQEPVAEPLELIVVESGAELSPLPHLGDWPVRRVRADSRFGGTAGSRRAAGLAAARGTWIACCDVGEVWSPGHLRTLLAAARADPAAAAIAGLDPAADDGEEAPAPAAGAAIVRVAAARDAGGFDPTLETEAGRDLWLRIGHCYPVRRIPAVVADGGETARRGDDDRERQLVDEDQWRWQIRSRRTTQVRRAAGPRVPFDPATWQDGRRRLLWQSDLDSATSFAAVARRLIAAVERRGVAVTVGPFRPGHEFDPTARRRLGFHYDYRLGPAALGCERLVHYGMWESTHVPCHQVQAINDAASLLYVPCRQNAASYAARGVRVPIKVLPHGVDPAEFPYLERPARSVRTFGSLGDLASARKGMDVLLRAFRAEFATGEAVRLLLKRTFAADPDEIDQAARADPRITVVTGVLDQAALLALLGEMDAFVLPSRGEGFGLAGLEAMATGLPTIATDWSGPADYLDPADSFPLAYRLVDAAGADANAARYFGQWAEPDETHLRTLLRRLYDHPDQGRAMGRCAAARIHVGWTWDQAAAQLVADLDALAAGVSPA